MFIENKIAVITGGTSGIGLAAARQFFKEDARLSRTGAANSRTGLASKDPGSASLPGRRDRLAKLAWRQVPPVGDDATLGSTQALNALCPSADRTADRHW